MHGQTCIDALTRPVRPGWLRRGDQRGRRGGPGRLQRLCDDIGNIGHRPDVQHPEHLGRHIIEVGLIALRDENR